MSHQPLAWMVCCDRNTEYCGAQAKKIQQKFYTELHVNKDSDTGELDPLWINLK